QGTPLKHLHDGGELLLVQYLTVIAFAAVGNLLGAINRIARQQTLLQSFAETGTEDRMHLMLSLLRQSGFQLSIEPINIGCLKLLQPLRAERGDHMDAHELFISLNRTSACAFLFAARSTNRQPVLSPLSKRYLAGLDVRSIVTRFEQLAQFGL